MRSAREGKRGATLAQKLTFVRHPNANLQREWLCRRKNAPILLAGIEERADNLLTGDFTTLAHILAAGWKGVVILSPSLYLRVREGGS